MKPIFTLHAGEYLLGSHIETIYPKWNVWVPSKDTGIDLLVTDARNRKAVSLQAKFSKDFTPTNGKDIYQSKLTAAGWWALQEKKIRQSKADLWVFVLPSFFEHCTSYIIIPPSELLRRLRLIHGRRSKIFQSYFDVTKSGRCWESRGLPKADREMLAFDRLDDKARDFTPFLNAWRELQKRLK